jgi:energy-coupling factor transport system substrate-specific component
MKRVALVTLALVLTGSAHAASPVADSVGYLKTRELPGGGFAEPGDLDPSSGLTAWAVIGLRAAGANPSRDTRDYLEAQEEALPQTTDVALALVARAALGDRAPRLVARLRADARPNGSIGPTVNSTIWGVLALRQARETVPRATTRYLLARQSRSGGWSWSAGGAPDSNDTAAAIQALRAVGVRGRPITRALAFLRRHQNRDGGFELTLGRGSDTQSTAWAIQAFLAARVRPGAAAHRYLARMRRNDGSYRYSARYVTTPVWVTSQALAALAGKPLPLR